MLENNLCDNFEPIRIELDKETSQAISRLTKIFGFNMSIIICESLRPFIDAFLPLADLHEQGKLVDGCFPGAIKMPVEFLTVKADVAKIEIDKELMKIEKQKKIVLRSKK